jgi:hypothetical protein
VDCNFNRTAAPASSTEYDLKAHIINK